MKKIIAVLVINILILCSSCNTLKVYNCKPFTACNTMINVSFYNVEDYKIHYDNIKDIYEDVDKVSSSYEDYWSELAVYDLNNNRSIVANDVLVDLVNNAVNIMGDTNGYFNPFIGRLSDLWKNAIKNNIILDNETISNELEIMNSTSVEINGNTITLIGDGNLDLGGIAKGYATQKAYEYLKDNNIEGYLINAGASNVIYGKKIDGMFKAGLRKPLGEGYYKILEGSNMMISTSSFEHQNIKINDNYYHHIINPKTGYPEQYYHSVNVINNNSMTGDIYSTAIFSMDKDEAIAFSLEKNIDIILYKDDNILYESEGL